jgi:hypothetical protein
MKSLKAQDEHDNAGDLPAIPAVLDVAVHNDR